MPTCCNAPRSISAMNGSPAIWSENLVQRAQSTQRSRSSSTCEEMLIGLGKVRLTSSKRLTARPLVIAWFCSGHSPPLSQTGQSSGWLMSSSSITPFCAFAATGEECWVLTFMPGATVMVHDACGFGIGLTLPSRSGIATSTRHCRQAPTGSRSGWSQNRGIWIPISSAARMTRVPSGTVTSMSSIVSVTVLTSSGIAALSPVSTALPPAAGELVTVMRGGSPSRTASSARAGTARAPGCACRPRTPPGSTAPPR